MKEINKKKIERSKEKRDKKNKETFVADIKELKR